MTLDSSADPTIVTRTHTRTAKLSKRGHEQLNDFLFKQQKLYNAALQERVDCYRKTGKSISLYDQYKSLTEVRADDPDIRQYSLRALRSCLNRLDEAFKSFFRRVKEGKKKPGFPRYKSRRRMRSFDCPKGGFRLREHKKGWSVNIKGLEPFIVSDIPPGDIKLVRVVVTARRVNVQFVVETQVVIEPCDAPVIGIDRGVTHIVALSNGETVEGRKRDLRRKKRLQRRLKVDINKKDAEKRPEHRKLKTKRSKSYKKARVRHAKECQRVREREHSYLHRETARIVQLSPNLAIEDLQIQNLVKNHKLARSILEQGWGKFANMLTYKAERAGGKVTRVDPKNTSRMCSGCGNVKTELSLSERVYTCSSCGLHIDRDVNAAINISRIASKSGGNSPGGFGDIEIESCSDLLLRGDTPRAQNSMLSPDVGISI